MAASTSLRLTLRDIVALSEDFSTDRLLDCVVSVNQDSLTLAEYQRVLVPGGASTTVDLNRHSSDPSVLVFHELTGASNPLDATLVVTYRGVAAGANDISFNCAAGKFLILPDVDTSAAVLTLNATASAVTTMGVVHIVTWL